MKETAWPVCGYPLLCPGRSHYQKAIVDGNPPDVVIASSTYPMDVYPAVRMAKKYQAKVVYEVHDLWPMSPMELGGMSKHHPFILATQRAENYAYTTAMWWFPCFPTPRSICWSTAWRRRSSSIFQRGGKGRLEEARFPRRCRLL